MKVPSSDEFRLAIAGAVAAEAERPPIETIPDPVEAALARRDFTGAIRLVESQAELGGFGLNDLFLLAYVYCLNGEVTNAEDLAARMADQLKKIGLLIGCGENYRLSSGFIRQADSPLTARRYL